MSSIKPEWVEVNIFLRDYSLADNFLCVVVAQLVQHVKAKFGCETWHFFREPEIRLRFLTERSDEVRSYLDQDLRARVVSGGSLVEKYIFGSHGVAGKKYPGEQKFWGKDWPIAMKQYEYGAETALAILSKNPSKNPPSNPISLHGQRYVHLLLNQLGYSYLDEAHLLGKMQVDAGVMALSSGLQNLEKRLERIEKVLKEKK